MKLFEVPIEVRDTAFDELLNEENWMPSLMTINAEVITAAYKVKDEGEYTNIRYGYSEGSYILMAYEDFLTYWKYVLDYGPDNVIVRYNYYLEFIQSNA